MSRRPALAVGLALGASASVAASRGVVAAIDPRQALRRRPEAGQRSAPVDRRARPADRSARASNRRWPPGVVQAGTRPSSAQRRSVSGSTPSSRLAGPERQPAPAGTRGGSRIEASLDVRLDRLDVRSGADGSAQPWGETAGDPSAWLKTWVNLGTRSCPGEERIGPPLRGRQPRAAEIPSGGDELVVVAVDPVAQAPTSGASPGSEGRDMTGRMISRTSPCGRRRSRAPPSSRGRALGHRGTGTGRD